MKPVAPRILHPRKIGVKEWRHGIWTGTRILRAKVKVVSVPLCKDINDIVKLGLLGRRFDMLRSKLIRYQFLTRVRDFCFYPIRNTMFCWFFGGVHPCFLFPGHLPFLCGFILWFGFPPANYVWIQARGSPGRLNSLVWHLPLLVLLLNRDRTFGSS